MKTGAFLPLAAAFAALAGPANAAIFVDGIGSTIAVPGSFAFKAQLESDYSLAVQGNQLTSISLTSPARLSFYAVGSESAYTNSFFFGPISSTEADFAYDPTRFIGSITINSPTSLGGLAFSSSGGLPAVPGSSNFAVFLPTGFSGTSFTTDRLIFGYDDGGGGDNDFDDFVILAQISPIPEPRTWLLMLAGFGIVGMQMRRSRRKIASTAY